MNERTIAHLICAVVTIRCHCENTHCDKCCFFDSETERCALALPPCDWKGEWVE